MSEKRYRALVEKEKQLFALVLEALEKRGVITVEDREVGRSCRLRKREGEGADLLRLLCQWATTNEACGIEGNS